MWHTFDFGCQVMRVIAPFKQLDAGHWSLQLCCLVRARLEILVFLRELRDLDCVQGRLLTWVAWCTNIHVVVAQLVVICGAHLDLAVLASS